MNYIASHHTTKAAELKKKKPQQHIRTPQQRGVSHNFETDAPPLPSTNHFNPNLLPMRQVGPRPLHIQSNVSEISLGSTFKEEKEEVPGDHAPVVPVAQSKKAGSRATNYFTPATKTGTNFDPQDDQLTITSGFVIGDGSGGGAVDRRTNKRPIVKETPTKKHFKAENTTTIRSSDDGQTITSGFVIKGVNPNSDSNEKPRRLPQASQRGVDQNFETDAPPVPVSQRFNPNLPVRLVMPRPLHAQSHVSDITLDCVQQEEEEEEDVPLEEMYRSYQRLPSRPAMRKQ
ncbi:MAG: hypothetical protein SGBAC_009689 [Bacillariaceae sp.]